MPPRWITLTIVALWLASTSWMVYRDVWPRLRPGQPPPFNIDLTEEVGGNRTSWEVFQNGNLIGFAETKVRRRQRDRTFVLNSIFRFDKLVYFGIELRKVESNYHVTAAGELRSLNAKVYWLQSDRPAALKMDPFVISVDGKVQDGEFLSSLDLPFPDPSHPTRIDLPPVPVSKEGSVLNPMHPLNKVTGLYEGQTWRVPLVDPLRSLAAEHVIGADTGPRYLMAAVEADSLEWQDKHGPVIEITDVPCWRIDYSEPGKRPTARTWVRQSDGLVLQQEANHDRLNLVLRRELKTPRTTP